MTLEEAKYILEDVGAVTFGQISPLIGQNPASIG